MDHPALRGRAAAKGIAFDVTLQSNLVGLYYLLHAAVEAGVQCVVAEFYARIFFRNSVNGGYLVPFESTERLVDKIRTGDELEIHTDQQLLINKTQNTRHQLKPLGDVLPIIEAGGVFNYAKQAGMLK